ncbi:MAG: substrate-binding domain-containing protein [Gammaproteobacteria bacterium]
MTTTNTTISRRAGCAIVLFAAALCLPLAAGGGINIVGSSTVYPFSTVAAERFAQITGNKAPKVEATGSGGGLKIFCGGKGEATPDITNASRRIKPSEQKLCAQNGAGDILEVKIGYDGIVIGQSATADAFALTPKVLFLALARQIPDGNGGVIDNPHRQWRDVDSSLPQLPIRVYGPPPSSGTRDAFVELVMDEGCHLFDELKALPKDRRKAACRALREDGAYIEAGENDNLIIQKLTASPDALGIFGFSFLDANRGKIRGLSINGIAPDFDSVSDGAYPVSRPLYFYAKLSHYKDKPELESFVRFFVSEDVMGEDGFLAERGLIPLPPDEYDLVVGAVEKQKPMAQL